MTPFSDRLKKWSSLPITLAWMTIIHSALCGLFVLISFMRQHLILHCVAQIGVEVLVILPQQSESLLFSKAFDL